MASIENRSHYEVSVKHRDDLNKTFAHNAKQKAEAYGQSLAAQGFKPKLIQLDNYYAIRDRSVSRPIQTLFASSKAEAEDIKARLEIEQWHSVFIDYAQPTCRCASIRSTNRLRTASTRTLPRLPMPSPAPGSS